MIECDVRDYLQDILRRLKVLNVLSKEWILINLFLIKKQFLL
jgi:hypothetical protein